MTGKTICKIDNYTILYTCGRGSYGTVFIAQDDNENVVALKAVGTKFGDHGERELQALKSYRKCNGIDCLLKIYDVVKKDDSFYYTMEPADNFLGASNKNYEPYTLERLLKSRKKLDFEQTRELVLQLLEGLEALHSRKLVHRDIKPANIFFVNKRAKLGDIGLLANDNSQTYRAGTPYFLPPEDSGIPKNSAAVDLYAMKRLIYCCLSGRPASDYTYLYDLPVPKKDNGLFKILLLPDEKLPDMSAKDFQRMLRPEPMPLEEMTAAAISPGRSAPKPAALPPLVASVGAAEAKSWVAKQGLPTLCGALAGLAAAGLPTGLTAAGLAGLTAAGLPVVLAGLPVVLAYHLVKSKTKKRK